MISNCRCLDTMGYKVVLFLQSSGVTVGSLAFKENIARWYVLTKILSGEKFVHLPYFVIQFHMIFELHLEMMEKTIPLPSAYLTEH